MRALQAFAGHAGKAVRAGAMVFARPNTATSTRAAPRMELLRNPHATNLGPTDRMALSTMSSVITHLSSSSSASDSTFTSATAASRGWAVAGVTSFGLAYMFSDNISTNGPNDSMHTTSDQQSLPVLPKVTPPASLHVSKKPLQKQTAAYGVNVQAAQQASNSSSCTSIKLNHARHLLVAGGLVGLDIMSNSTVNANNTIVSYQGFTPNSKASSNSSSSINSSSRTSRAQLSTLPSAYEADRLSYAVKLQHTAAQPVEQAAPSLLKSGSSSSSSITTSSAVTAQPAPQAPTAVAAYVAVTLAAALATKTPAAVIETPAAATAATTAAASSTLKAMPVATKASVTATVKSNSSRVAASDAGSTSSNDLADWPDKTMVTSTASRATLSGAKQFWAQQAAAAAAAAAAATVAANGAKRSTANGSVMGAAGFMQSGSSRCKDLTKGCRVTAGGRAACSSSLLGSESYVPGVLSTYCQAVSVA